MKIYANKIIGGFLLILGTGIIIATLLHSYQIFNASTPVPRVFELGETIEKEKEKGIGGLDIEAQLSQKIEEQISKMLPTGAVSKLLNLIAWSIFSSTAIFGGSKISQLGIKLLK